MFIYNFKFPVIHNLHINFDLDVGINFLPIDEFRYRFLALGNLKLKKRKNGDVGVTWI